MNKIVILLLVFLSFNFVVFSDNSLFMDQGSRKKSRHQLKKEYERCKNKLYADLTPSAGNKIEKFDVAGLRHRVRFSSVDIVDDSKTLSNVVRWPRGEVPVELEHGFTNAERSSLKCAILYFRAHTCLKFLTKNDSHEDYLYLTKTHKKGGCFTDVVGKQGGKQTLNLDPASDHCWEHGTIIHELMHVLGFFHEHSRIDRDKYVVIHWNNIPKSLHFQYWTTEDMGYTHKDVGKYDYESVMHYSRYLGFDLALSAKVHDDQYEEQATNNDAMGQRIGPSDEDTIKINLMYCPHLVLQPLDCEDELDCSSFLSLCSISKAIRKKCKNTCGLCHKEFSKETVQPAPKSAIQTTTLTSISTAIMDSTTTYFGKEAVRSAKPLMQTTTSSSVTTADCTTDCHCAKEDNKDIIGGRALTNIEGVAERACCAFCHNTKDCKAYAWNSYSNGTCWLKSATEPKVRLFGTKIGIIKHDRPTQAGFSSCTKLNNKDIHGGRSVGNIHGQTEDLCCHICRQTENCRAYAWSSYSGGTCWLKSAAQPIVDAPGVKMGILN